MFQYDGGSRMVSEIIMGNPLLLRMAVGVIRLREVMRPARIAQEVIKYFDSQPRPTSQPSGFENPKIEDILGAASDLEDSSLSGLGPKVDDLGGGAYHLVYKIGVMVILIALFAGGIYLALAGAQNRNEAKSRLLHIIGGALIAFSAVGIVVALANLGQNLFR